MPREVLQKHRKLILTEVYFLTRKLMLLTCLGFFQHEDNSIQIFFFKKYIYNQETENLIKPHSELGDMPLSMCALACLCIFSIHWGFNFFNSY